MIKIRNVSAGYNGEEILHDIDLDFEVGKVTVIIGPNGCGKSTLLKTLIRLIPHTKGDIFVGEEPAENLDSRALARKVAYLPQNKRVPDISVLRMVLHGRFAYLNYPRRYRAKDYEIAQKALDQVGIGHLAEKNMSDLSGGTQQKVYIAAALAQDTPVVLLDEPTTYLDISHQLKAMELAKELAAQGKAVVMVLHDLSHAFRVADTLVVMKDGKVCACGTPEEICENGMVERVFEVQIEKVQIKGQWAYICM